MISRGGRFCFHNLLSFLFTLLCSSFLHSSPFSCLFGYSYLLFLPYLVLSFSLENIILPFLFFKLSWISISIVSISGYSLPFSYLYLGSSCIFVLHFSFSFTFLQLCVNAGFHGTHVCIFLSIPLLVAYILSKKSAVFSIGASCLKVNMLLYNFPFFIHPFCLVSWCAFICHQEQIHTFIISFFQFLYLFSSFSLLWVVEFIM